jgi:ribonuclease VapC
MTVVIDSSAAIAIMLDEPAADDCARAMTPYVRRLMSTGNFVETGAVLAGRLGSAERETVYAVLEDFLSVHEIDLVPVTPEQARIALRARIELGRGFGHPARLNYGDSFAYALAKAEGAKLLFVGDDFAMTDVERAL